MPAETRSRTGRNPPHAPQPPVLTVRRGTLAAAGAAFAVLAAWGAGTAWYILFKDHVAARLVAKHTAMQYAYEEKLGALRARVDRVASQKLLEQDGLETRVAELVARQIALENRHAVLATLADQGSGPATTSSLRPERPAAARPRTDVPAAARAYVPVQPAAEQEPFTLRLRSDDGPRPARAGERHSAIEPSGPMEVRLALVERSLTRTEAMQLRTLAGLLHSAGGEVSRLRSAVAEVGLNPEAVRAPGGDAVGGPFVALGAGADAGQFEAILKQAQTSIIQLDRLRRVASSLPFGRPVAGEADLTSAFGYRSDPFTRRAALHTGLDFRADHGAPVRATAAGTVTAAEREGGYGNLVEIDHGNGVVTRYAHLSVISVVEGQRVEAGAVVGRIGSTGRSTGPHLHYETRINDEPVDPQRFLRAGARLTMARVPPDGR